MKLNKKCLCSLAMLLLVMTSGMAVHADAGQIDNTTAQAVVDPRKEETEWVFRINPDTDVLEKRLWSNTYGKWKTEWEPVVSQ